MLRENETELGRISRQGTEAWRRLKKEKSWRDWIAVGEALAAGRDWAMNQALTNQPIGKAYNMAFGEWLQRYKLDDMDKGDRSRLFTVMDNLGMIEDWRKTLTQTQRLALNHPNTVLRKWQRAIEPEDKTTESKPTLRDSVVNLSEQNHEKDREIEQLKARIVELEEELVTARTALQTVPTYGLPVAVLDKVRDALAGTNFERTGPLAPSLRDDLRSLMIRSTLGEKR